jgi:hypothetical protein
MHHECWESINKSYLWRYSFCLQNKSCCMMQTKFIWIECLNWNDFLCTMMSFMQTSCSSFTVHCLLCWKPQTLSTSLKFSFSDSWNHVHSYSHKNTPKLINFFATFLKLNSDEQLLGLGESWHFAYIICFPFCWWYTTTSYLHVHFFWLIIWSTILTVNCILVLIHTPAVHV